MRNAAIGRLLKFAESNRNIVLMAGDLGYGVLDRFVEMLPDQFCNAGICEQNMTSMAAGMALEGKTVFTYSIANFPTLRSLEQIRNDVAYHNADVKIIAVGCGFAYGSLGMSHHATEDIAIMRALPNITVLAPGDPVEAEWAIEEACRIKGPVYIRLGKGKEPNIHKSSDGFASGKAIKVTDGADVVIFATGAVLSESEQAVKALNSTGVSVALWSFPSIKPFDVEAVRECASNYSLVVTVEEGTVLGGLGGAVAEVISEMVEKKAVLRRIGLNDQYSSIVGSQEYLRDCYGMSSKKLVDSIQRYMSEVKNG